MLRIFAGPLVRIVRDGTEETGARWGSPGGGVRGRGGRAAEKGRMHVASWAEHRFGVKDNAQASVNDLAPQSYCSLRS